jgi:S1-C subfamily serine protease
MLRRGIISSVFPFASPFPHGFTIDAMVQPGASGSPIFLEDQPVVVGMVESVLRDHATASITSTETGLSGTVSVPLSTNISVALPGGLIADALRDLCQGGQLKTEGLPTLQSLVPEDHERYRQMTWETFTVPRGE